MAKPLEPIGIDKQGNTIILDYKNTHVEYHLLETPNLIDLVKEVLPTIETNGQDQVIIERDIGRIIGTTNLVETDDTDEIVYAKRIGRETYCQAPHIINTQSKPVRS